MKAILLHESIISSESQKKKKRGGQHLSVELSIKNMEMVVNSVQCFPDPYNTTHCLDMRRRLVILSPGCHCLMPGSHSLEILI